MRFSCLTLFVVAGCAVTSQSYGQPDWQFTRLPDFGVEVHSNHQAEAGSDSDFDGIDLFGDIFLNVATDASASDSNPPGSAFAQNIAMSQAMNLTPIGATTFAPTVDTTVFQSDIASASSPKTATSGIGVEGGTTAFSSGSYTLDGSPTSGFLHGSMYLVGLVNGSESGDGEYLGSGFVDASVNEFSVFASYSNMTELWDVTVNLPGITDSFSTAGVNNFFTFTIPVSLPMTVDLETTSDTTARARAFPAINDNVQAQGQVNLSASAWAVFTPTSAPPPDGDFDGDGDVDGGDFLALQRGLGASDGATLSQGDADHNGMVDSVDLSIWEGNYPTSPPLSETVAAVVPEPTSVTLVLFSVAVAAMCCNRRSQLSSLSIGREYT